MPRLFFALRNCLIMATCVFEKASVVRGHHIYKASWTPKIGEEHPLKTEERNDHDNHAVAVMKNDNVVGNVPRSISKVTWFFLKRSGKVTCRITGKRKYGVGLEVPCVYTYSGPSRIVSKLRRLRVIHCLKSLNDPGKL